MATASNGAQTRRRNPYGLTLRELTVSASSRKGCDRQGDRRTVACQRIHREQACREHPRKDEGDFQNAGGRPRVERAPHRIGGMVSEGLNQRDAVLQETTTHYPRIRI